MKRTWFDVAGVVVVLAWAAWLGSLALDGLGLAAPERLALTPEEIAAGFREGEEWQGIYLKDQKVGYLQMKKELRADGFHLESRMVLHMTVMKTRRKIETDFQGELDRDMVLRTFEMTIESGPATMRIDGSVEGRDVVVNFHSAGSVQTERVTLKEPPRMSFSMRHMLASGQLKPGQPVAMPFFDPASMSEREVTIELVGTEVMPVMGEEVEAYHLVQRFDRTALHVWTNAIGEVLKEELPMGLVGLREPEAEARYGLTTGTASSADDVIEAVAVRPTGAPFPGEAPEATVRLKGLDFVGFTLEGGRQQWTPDAAGEGGVLRLRVEPLEGRDRLTLAELQPRLAGEGEEAAQLLAATRPEVLVQSDHPKVQSQALRVLGVSSPGEVQGRPILEVSRKLSGWVHEALEKENVIGVPSALEVLETRRGDCNEHATLTTALLRSVGVPARMAVGIAWLGSHGRFFYHAWVEVWAEGWVAIDPTFGQFPADIGHLRFIAGGLKDQMEMFRVIGQLQLEVVP